jgi:hypothetical protein
MARAQLAGVVFVALASKPSADQRLSITGAAVAATSAFVLDDAATATLGAVPTSLPRRRLQRVVATAATIALWWIVVAAITDRRADGIPLTGRLLEMSTLVAIALAVSAVGSAVGDRTTGGIAGAVVVGCCYVLMLLPPSRWVPFAHPDADGARMRLLIALGSAVTLLVMASRDPACRPLTSRHRRG